MEQFNKLNQQLAAAQAEFTSNIEGGGVTNMPTDITEVASYTDVPLLDMKTTAVAEGGRIGFKEGTNFQTWLKNNFIDTSLVFLGLGGVEGYVTTPWATHDSFEMYSEADGWVSEGLRQTEYDKVDSMAYGGKAGETSRVERQIHHYGSSLNAIPVLNHYRKKPEDLYLLKVGYGGLLGGISNITQDGFGPAAFHSYPSTLKIDGISGDYGSGFYGYAVNTSSYLTKDEDMGWLAFGDLR